MRYCFMTIAILAVWLGMELLAWRQNNIGIFAPIFAIALSVILFAIGFGKKA